MQKSSWLKKLGSTIKKSAQGLNVGLSEIFSSSKGQLDQKQIEEIQDLLIQNDVGFETVCFICNKLKGKILENVEIAKSILAEEIAKILEPYSVPFSIQKTPIPYTIIMAGVNGSGKTTTITKLSQKLLALGFSVEWAACDTFRAAAVEQMQVWADRINVSVYKSDLAPGKKQDPAALAFRAFQETFKKKTDVLFIDTAGRLYNNDQLMQELAKIVRSLKKINNEIPHKNILVLDGIAGQNVLHQVEAFKKLIPITDLIITKLDGTAKAGFVIELCRKFQLNIAAIGIGEAVDDLDYFAPKVFAESLLGL
ncbi:MAG: signal recognition particle-docking protein FtsY [Holosporales bacterium]|jgi:fused signal recognition particle receptor|nr:signal recognition particle-docking protein FtsY [Holosporales bacterium]